MMTGIQIVIFTSIEASTVKKNYIWYSHKKYILQYYIFFSLQIQQEHDGVFRDRTQNITNMIIVRLRLLSHEQFFF